MQTQLSPAFQGTHAGDTAAAVLQRCVHCGFCNATCPTYQATGNELDGPRGRIYLMKQVFEGQAPTQATQSHLDACLTCRSCETTCPSGVNYADLLAVGRDAVDAQVKRPRAERFKRWLLREGLTSSLFGPAVRVGRWLRPVLPAALRSKLPLPAGPRAHQWPTQTHSRKVLLLMGCVQPSLAPNINSATARVLNAAGIQTLVADHAACCGAIHSHLGDTAGGLAYAQTNIDAWWPLLQKEGIEAIVTNASGCGVTVKDYGKALAHDPFYAAKAKQISALAVDVSELLPSLLPALKTQLRRRGWPEPSGIRIAYHPPCTLQHGQGLRGGVEHGLRELGFEVLLPTDAHLCCGSAGTYSLLQPEMAHGLQQNKVHALEALQASTVVSGNIGCIQHLQAGTALPVRHWVELVDAILHGDVVGV